MSCRSRKPPTGPQCTRTRTPGPLSWRRDSVHWPVCRVGGAVIQNLTMSGCSEQCPSNPFFHSTCGQYSSCLFPWRKCPIILVCLSPIANKSKHLLYIFDYLCSRLCDSPLLCDPLSTKLSFSRQISECLSILRNINSFFCQIFELFSLRPSFYHIEI